MTILKVLFLTISRRRAPRDTYPNTRVQDVWICVSEVGRNLRGDIGGMLEGFGCDVCCKIYD